MFFQDTAPVSMLPIICRLNTDLSQVSANARPRAGNKRMLHRNKQLLPGESLIIHGYANLPDTYPLPLNGKRRNPHQHRRIAPSEISSESDSKGEARTMPATSATR